VKTDEAGRVLSSAAKSAPFAELAKQAASLRRNAQHLNSGAVTQDIRNEIFNLERLAKRLARRKWQSAEQAETLARLPDLKREIQNLEEIVERISAFEDDTLLCFYGKQQGEKQTLQAQLIELSEKFNDSLLQIYGLQFKKADVVTLAVFGENSEWLFELGRRYYEIILEHGASVELVGFVAPTTAESEEIKQRIKAGEKLVVYNLFDRITIKKSIEKPGDFLHEPNSRIAGIAMRIKGVLALPKYQPEWGLHIWTKEKQTRKNLVHTSEARLDEYVPPKELEKRGSISHQEERRKYNFSEETVEDFFLKEKFFMQRDDFKLALRHAIEKHLVNNAKALLEDS
jgi:hypothetical protein